MLLARRLQGSLLRNWSMARLVQVVHCLEAKRTEPRVCSRQRRSLAPSPLPAAHTHCAGGLTADGSGAPTQLCAAGGRQQPACSASAWHIQGDCVTRACVAWAVWSMPRSAGAEVPRPAHAIPSPPERPAGVGLQVMAQTIRAARPHELARMRMDDNLTFFEDAMGSMERILRTPIPLRWETGRAGGMVPPCVALEWVCFARQCRAAHARRY